MYLSALSTPKLGNSAQECEDAHAVYPKVAPDEIIDTGPVVVAVADGASESLLAKNWANILATTLVQVATANPGSVSDGADFAVAVRHATRKWDDWLENYLNYRAESRNPIRWYEQPGLERGAHSAVLVAYFTLCSSHSGEWHAGAIGDVCLFQVRDNMLIQSFPITSSTDFTNSPALLNSKIRDGHLVATRTKFVSGDYMQGDQFFVGTDALAAWFLAGFEEGGRPWEALQEFSYHDDAREFTTWVQEERSSGRMRNDDVTVVHVDLG